MKRIGGIDFGQARIGLALSDERRLFASPLKVISPSKTLKETALAILAAFSSHEPVEILVIGLPLMMNGKDSPGCKPVRELAEIFKEISDKTTVLWDERLTTTQVERTLKEVGMSRKKRAKVIDGMAAAMILQSYLDSPCNK